MKEWLDIIKYGAYKIRKMRKEKKKLQMTRKKFVGKYNGRTVIGENQSPHEEYPKYLEFYFLSDNFVCRVCYRNRCVERELDLVVFYLKNNSASSKSIKKLRRKGLLSVREYKEKEKFY